jgi:hypothetical protein
MNPKERLDDAVEAAEEAFWAAVAQRFPEITTGDLPPDVVIPLHLENEKAICHWLGGNSGIFPSFPDDYVNEHYCNECGEIKVPAGVKLCKDCEREGLSREMGID